MPKKPNSHSAEPGPSDKQSDVAEQTFPVVGVGASAGGLDAFTKLLKNLPADTGMAFVLVQHLDPKHVSLLPELLARATAMPVSAGRFFSSLVKASSPPAEAPTPTTGNICSAASDCLSLSPGSVEWELGFLGICHVRSSY